MLDECNGRVEEVIEKILKANSSQDEDITN